jgi:hypothetical protein
MFRWASERCCSEAFFVSPTSFFCPADALKTHVRSGVNGNWRAGDLLFIAVDDCGLLRELFTAFFCICGCTSTHPFVGHVGQIGRRSSHRLDTEYFVRPFRHHDAVLIRPTLGTRPSPRGTSDWFRGAKAGSADGTRQCNNAISSLFLQVLSYLSSYYGSSARVSFSTERAYDTSLLRHLRRATATVGFVVLHHPPNDCR